MAYREEWNVPNCHSELVANGGAQYSIIGVVMNDNADAMRIFLDVVNVPADEIELHDGTQVILRYPPDPSKMMVIDAGGLGDFDRHGFDVHVVLRDTEQLRIEERRDEGPFGVGA